MYEHLGEGVGCGNLENSHVLQGLLGGTKEVLVHQINLYVRFGIWDLDAWIWDLEEYGIWGSGDLELWIWDLEAPDHQMQTRLIC